MRPLRVVHVINQLAIGGTEYNVVKLANRLDRARFRPVIAALRDARPDARALVDRDVPVWEFQRRDGLDGRLVAQLSRRLQDEGVDIVHSHNWSTYFYSVLSSRLAGIPIVIHGEHGLERDNLVEPVRRVLLRRILARMTDHFTGVSREICHRLEFRWGGPADRITFIPNGVDLTRFGQPYPGERTRAALGISPGDPVIISVGALRPVKDYGSLIRAFTRVLAVRPSSVLLLVGHDMEHGFQARLRAESPDLLPTLERVQFLGVRMDTPELLSIADVYVNSSLYEGMANTILEAMASRKPIVATEVGGTPELVKHRVNGLLVPPRDPGALAEGILEILSDPATASRMGARGREEIERHHSFARMISLNEDLYETLVALKARPMSLDGHAKTAVARVSAAAGLTRLAERRSGDSLALLTYHRILPLAAKRRTYSQSMILPCDAFERQMATLRRRYRVLSLEEVLEHYRTRRPFAPRSVHVTFDDGYADNHAYALPILDQYSIPATIFLVTGAIDSGQSLWWDELGQALLCLHGRRPQQNGEVFRLTPESLHPALVQVFEGLGPAVPQIDRCIRTLNRHYETTRRGVAAALAGLAAPYRDAPPSRLMLTWDQIRDMQRSRLTLGGHTVRHVFLSELDDATGREEVRRCLDRIEQEMGCRPKVFSYPAGRVSEQSRPWFEEAGVELAMTTRGGPNRAGDDRYALRRWDASYLAVEDRFVGARMRLELSGMMDWAAPFRAYEPGT